MTDFRTIARANVPAGWKLREQKRIGKGKRGEHGADKYKNMATVAKVDYEKKTIYVLPLEGLGPLFDFFHEVGHVILHSESTKPTHQEEYEAEIYAMRRFKDFGFTLPKYEIECSKAYVKACIRADEELGIPISRSVKKYVST